MSIRNSPPVDELVLKNGLVLSHQKGLVALLHHVDAEKCWLIPGNLFAGLLARAMTIPRRDPGERLGDRVQGCSSLEECFLKSSGFSRHTPAQRS